MAKKTQDLVEQDLAVTQPAVDPPQDLVTQPAEDSPTQKVISSASEIKAKYEAIVKEQGKGLDGPQFEAYTAELKADRKAVDAAREASK